jgi:hypothetical protein
VIQVHGDYASIDHELDRITDLPNGEMKGLLDAVLASAFAATQEDVHVETGSLKSSGRTETHSSEHGWHGEIHYGGPSAGVNNPVDYAIYEKRRGGAHDFFAPLAVFDDAFAEAIKEGLSG